MKQKRYSIPNIHAENEAREGGKQGLKDDKH